MPENLPSKLYAMLGVGPDGRPGIINVSGSDSRWTPCVMFDAEGFNLDSVMNRVRMMLPSDSLYWVRFAGMEVLRVSLPATIARTPDRACPGCNTPLNGADGPSTPQPGDFAVCGHCGDYLVFESDLTVRGMTEEEVLALDAEALGELARMRKDALRRRKA